MGRLLKHEALCLAGAVHRGTTVLYCVVMLEHVSVGVINREILDYPLSTFQVEWSDLSGNYQVKLPRRRFNLPTLTTTRYNRRSR